MKALSIIVVLFFSGQDVMGQISGRLTSVGGLPIPFANILVLKSADSVLVKAVVTDEKGAYAIGIGPGRYILRFSCVGYRTWDSPLLDLVDSNLQKDMGTRVMHEDSQQMGVVVVRAEKPLFQQQAGGMVVNVESSILTKGSSALEVLERSPGVIIDRQNNGISLNGKNGIMVMLNGKLLRMSIDQVVGMLNGMSADNIEKIELLTTPPARYDAQGSAGLINIVLKKSKKKGTNGTIALTGGYGWREKASGNISLDHNTGKVDVYGSYTYLRDRSFTDWHSIGTNNMPLLGGENHTDILSETKSRANNHNAILGLEVKPVPGLSFGGNIHYSNADVAFNTVNTAFYNVVPDSNYTLNAAISGMNHWNNWIFSVYAEKKLRNGQQINVDLDYLYYTNSNPSDAHSAYLNEKGNPAGSNDTLFSPFQRSTANTTIRVGVAKVDYSRPLGQKVKMEAGIKGTYSRDMSSSRISSLVNGSLVTRPETSNDIRMKESIGAGYLSFTGQPDATTSLIVGARYEYSDTRMVDLIKGWEVVGRKLGSLFPNLFFSKKFNERSEIIFSYTKRISRPSYNDLASFVVYTSPNSVESGNPFLKPTITHNLKVGYNYRNYAFSVLLSRDDRPIAGYQLSVSPDGDLIDLRPENLVYQNNITFQTYLPFKINSWWNMNYSFAGGWRQFKLDFTGQPVEKTYFGYSANFSQSFRLPKEFMLEFSGWYNGPVYNGTKKADGFGALNAGLKKELKNNAGTLQLTIQDIFKTVNITSRYGTLTKEAFDVKSHVVFTAESGKAQIIRLTYTRSFGGSKGGAGRAGNAGSKDEQERIRKN